jgi:para-nitrobenzyl esterase
LSIDLYTPVNATNRKLPVMVWFYGGGFVLGSNAQYDSPASLVSQGDVIVAVPNYRTGPLGFLALPELADEAKCGTGNYGIQDQQEALRWVQRNIREFGGDPANVTIFGESAGGASVCAQLASPAAKGLFVRAITQSGMCVSSIVKPPNKDIAFERSTRYASGIGCGDPATRLACLRSLPIDKVLDSPTLDLANAATDTVWTPVVDGVTLTATPEQALRSGAGQGITMIVGSNTNEGSTFAPALLDYGRGRLPTIEGYRSLLEGMFDNGEDVPRILDRYPVDAYPSVGDAEAAVITDSQFACPALWTVEAAQQGGMPVWQYQFAEAPLPPNPLVSGAFHFSDVPYLFSSMQNIPIPLTGAAGIFAKQLQRQWASFAHTGSPDAAGLPSWPQWTPSAPAALQMSSASVVLNENFSAEHECAFWATQRSGD